MFEAIQMPLQLLENMSEKCSHVHYMDGKQPFPKRCKSCKYDESVTSHTLFRKLKFPIEKAFKSHRIGPR